MRVIPQFSEEWTSEISCCELNCHSVGYKLGGFVGCQVNGMAVYFVGCTSIAHFMALATERAITMRNPVWAMSVRGKVPFYVYGMIAACWLYGFIWSLLPLLGE